MIGYILLGLFVIILVIWLLNKSKENFVQEFDLWNNKIDGSNELGKPEYQKVNQKYPRGIWQKKYLMGQQYHTRLPYLVEQQYSYKDLPTYASLKLEPDALPDIARLRELPLDLKNWWHGKTYAGAQFDDTKNWPTPYYLGEL